MKRVGLCLLALPLSMGPADAAMIERRQLNEALDLILLTGAIQQGDGQTFRDVAAASENAVVLLNSEGGSVVAALEIGRAIRLRNFSTGVTPGTLCASACALAWLAGSTRMLGDSSKIGFHAAYIVDGGKVSESGVGNALIGAYLNQIGLSEQAIVFVTSAPPQGIAWLSSKDASALGIPVAGFEASTVTILPDARIGPERYDPLMAVAKFYKALEIADGEAASSLVIPEKRGVGPFNENAIRSFYGSLQVPLELTSVSLIGKDTTEVTYTYTKPGGAACRGQAVVNTSFQFGKTLISRIRAPNGC